MKKNKVIHKRVKRISFTIKYIVSTFAMLMLTAILEAIFGALMVRYHSIKIISLSVFMVMLLISVGIGVVANYLAYYHFFKPISDINKAILEIAHGNLDVKVVPNKRCKNKEIIKMVEHFNDMAWELSNIETFHDDFISNVSHEFKTPISAIEGYAKLLQDESNTKEEQKKYTENIISNTKRLSKLTGNILEIAKFDNQKIHAKEKVFSLDEQIRQVLLSFEHQWTEKKLELELELEEVFICNVPGWLHEAWSNIIENAIKYSNVGGKLSIQVTSKKNQACVSISDQGEGMTEEECKHVYDKFYQADKSHTGEGNGLGLTLVKRIMDACGGEISMESKKGVGTTFRVILPKKTMDSRVNHL